ncbi:hypothetical protein CH253_19135 [Rhodococcus sp. 06-156-3C]|uniref:hypothetical protein n=1 Tax=Nocardiaceae TaxID=85025 RepID=UPI000522EE7A|nr:MULTISPECIES: hypothetical protein [Rhodococcus]OZD12557.1 hypothetical protein CH248_28505 [Rhodococcus sp. 06-156-4a]OZD18034.1 hypothetical protein CH253_19135 [Rhodococcus sp. 06-156-3C]OZD20405.1 hypothetical protein CH280_04455 [Rhodococcus sp. 06-156-4C]OZD29250.1 hypothetical protein CH284_27315 [Rhodococcus sp. 06-156-3]OZD30522.1 hypothetical protein CH247_14440 [Rhodococcus sp. 06-156-3b]
MTDHLKTAMRAMTEANRQRMLDVTQPFKDSFIAEPAMQRLIDSVSVKAQFDFSPLAEYFRESNRLSEIAKNQLMPATTTALSELAAIQVEPFRNSLIDAMPDISELWRDQIDTTGISKMAAGALANVELPQIDIGFKEVLNYNALFPKVDHPLADAMKQIRESQASIINFKAEVSSLTKAVSDNSGVGMLAAGALGDTYGTPFAEAIQRLVPQMPEFPDFTQLRDLVGTYVDDDLADAVEEQIASDPSKLEAFNTAVQSLVSSLKIPHHIAVKIVVATVYVFSYVAIFYALQWGPPELARTLSNLMTTGGDAVPPVLSYGAYKFMARNDKPEPA